ncbi:3-dehydroquinate synthase [Desulforhopalus singaporensis]|uniref:Shikimate kinase n=1 Tax=Desulforhopalus singaporensis TaxID=91360 RepID=A0A1H0KN51_9BACT|nr:3-dehydroquinate synthase [Desulforhopalus singaporensis]SDO57236.1 3-dehydroquinate synthase [Desulforhopalus singaporensis]
MQKNDKQNIVLTGFMGTGKTSVGKRLASELNRKFVDTDELIQERQGISIPEIFRQHGEAAFRKMESDIARELGQQEGLVISTGGRLMLDPANAAALSQKGRVFCLVATPQEILSRIKKDKEHTRPLLEVPNPSEHIVELLKERQQGYNRFQKIITDDKDPAEVTSHLLDMFREHPKRISIDHPAHPYDYVVGSGILPFVRQLAEVPGPLVVITDTTVNELYGQSCGEVDHIITIPVGNQHKTLATVQDIYDQLLDIGFDRSGTIMALGGSVVGDIAGFVAATYMRGVNLIQCPTSLLAMADTCIGGKTSIDLARGKNLIGAFKQPSVVIADIALLQSLPHREFISGMAEVIKHGLIADSDLLEKVINGDWHTEAATLHTSLFELQALVAQAIQVKVSIVREDPMDRGIRFSLNLGHTFAHAIEQVSGYTIRHGEAVAMGLVASVNLSARLGHCGADLQQRLETVLAGVGLPVRIPGLSTEELLKAMENDKKRVGKINRFVLLGKIGQPFTADNVDTRAVIDTLKEITTSSD